MAKKKTDPRAAVKVLLKMKTKDFANQLGDGLNGLSKKGREVAAYIHPDDGDQPFECYTAKVAGVLSIALGETIPAEKPNGDVDFTKHTGAVVVLTEDPNACDYELEQPYYCSGTRNLMAADGTNNNGSSITQNKKYLRGAADDEVDSFVDELSEDALADVESTFKDGLAIAAAVLANA